MRLVTVIFWFVLMTSGVMAGYVSNQVKVTTESSEAGVFYTVFNTENGRIDSGVAGQPGDVTVGIINSGGAVVLVTEGVDGTIGETVVYVENVPVNGFYEGSGDEGPPETTNGFYEGSGDEGPPETHQRLLRRLR